MVRNKSDALSASKDDVLRSKLKSSSAKSMYLPSISVTGSYTHLDKPFDIDTGKISALSSSLSMPIPIPSTIDLSKDDIFLANLHLLWPLYTGGKIDAMQDIYASRVDEAKALGEMQKDKTFLKLVKYYYGVVLANSLYKTRLDAQKALSLHLQHAQKLKEQGQIAKIEVLNARVKLDAAKIECTKAKHKLEIATQALFSMLKDAQMPLSSLFISADAKTKEYYKDETLLHYSGLDILDAKEKESASLVNIKKANWHPEVMAYGNYNLYKDDSPLMKSAPNWMVGVIVKFNILQRKDRTKEIQATHLLNSKVKSLKAQAIEDLKILVEKTYNEMQLYKDEYNSLDSSLDLAYENYRLRGIAFKEGLATSVEVVDAQLFLSAIKTKRLNALYNYVQKISQLSVLSGNRDMFFDIADRSEEIR
jgi:outer membrane protein TolC